MKTERGLSVLVIFIILLSASQVILCFNLKSDEATSVKNPKPAEPTIPVEFEMKNKATKEMGFLDVWFAAMGGPVNWTQLLMSSTMDHIKNQSDLSLAARSRNKTNS